MLFDVAPGPVPRDFLRSVGVDDVDAVMLSHLHEDHCAGVTGFLGGDYVLREVFMNGPRATETETYDDVKAALNRSRELRGGLPRVRPFDTDADRPVLERGNVQVQIVAPDAVDARSKTTRRGLRQSDHSGCGVVRVNYEDHPRVLITGDLDRKGLQAIVDRDAAALRADVLVYPHHGGSSEEPREEEFAEELCSHVQPDLVVFSTGRAKGLRPHAEVLSGVSTATTAEVVCTQLSRRCDEREPDHAGRLDPLPMAHSVKPELRRLSCGGSVVIPLEHGPSTFAGRSEHVAFLEESHTHMVPRPMCAE
jgi:beta-lactamase superfamily II metal-dependent hydrolase